MFGTAYSKLNNTGGYPDGVGTMKINMTSFELVSGTMTACFVRPLDTGHNGIKDGNAVIWASGPLAPPSNTPTYHGADGHDPTGATQTHRSDEVPAMEWNAGI